MGPKKNVVKMNLNEFLADESFGGAGSWADDAADLPLPSFDRPSYRNDGGFGNRPGTTAQGFSVRDTVPVPDHPPFTARLINLDYEANEDAVSQLFAEGFQVTSVRVPRDYASGRARGYAFVEFADKDSLVKALTLDGTNLLSRTIHVMVASSPAASQNDRTTGDSWRTEGSGPLGGAPEGGRGGYRDRGSEFGSGPRGEPRPDIRPDGTVRDFDNWERKGPLPPSNDNFRRGSGFREGPRDGPRDGPREGGFRSGPRPPRPEDDSRDFDNWDRKGPLPTREFREPRKPRDDDGDRDFDNWERKGPLPPAEPEAGSRRRGDYQPRQHHNPPSSPGDNGGEWRSSREPQSRGLRNDDSHSSESTSGPKQPRKKLELKPRTVKSDDATTTSPSSATRSSLFGSAKPVDTNRKFLEVEERQEKLDKERRHEHEKKHEEHQHHQDHRKSHDSSAKLESVRHKFEILNTHDDEEPQKEEPETKQTEEPTAVEQLQARQASQEELESDEWKTVPNKRSGRK